MKKTLVTQKPGINFDLHQLEIFCKVVELNSFSKAADEVLLAQATVSESIATLESRVGTKLLDRLGRKVSLTRAGELLYKNALRMLEMKKAICLEMDDFMEIRRGEILIGGSTIPGEYILPGIIKRFHHKYPAISVDLTVADSHTIEALALDGKIEIGIVGAKSLNKNLLKKTLWDDTLALAVNAKHRWANRETISIPELLKEPFILRGSGSGTLKILNDYLKQFNPGSTDLFQVVARFGTSTAVKEGIKAGLGVSILSKRALDTELTAGIIKVLNIKDINMTRKFYLIRDTRRTISPMCKAILDFLLDSDS